jgi:polysaccharide pyruvyl transferase CsaB
VRFLLSGYYGFGNLGDDALLAIIVGELKRRYPDGIIEVLTATPEETARDHGVVGTSRADFGEVRRAIARADVVLSGGGGLLQNVTSVRSLLYYAGILRSAVRRKKKTMIFAQSIGPLDFWGKSIVREFCRGVDVATVRDERSRVLLAPLLPATRVERTADPVFLLEPPANPLDLAAEGLGAESDPLVVVSVRRWAHGEGTTAVLAAAVDRLAEAHGARVAFLPLGGPSDAEASAAVIRRCRTSPVLLPQYELPQAAQVLARAKAVIGMRLHALIIAARLAVPFLAIPYDPKVSALCDDLAYPLPPLWTPGEVKAPDLAAVFAAVDTLWVERDRIAAHLREAVPRMHDLAERNFAALEELLAPETHPAASKRR